MTWHKVINFIEIAIISFSKGAGLTIGILAVVSLWLYFIERLRR